MMIYTRLIDFDEFKFQKKFDSKPCQNASLREEGARLARASMTSAYWQDRHNTTERTRLNLGQEKRKRRDSKDWHYRTQ